MLLGVQNQGAGLFDSVPRCPPVSAGASSWRFFSEFFRFFRWSKKRFKNGRPKNRLFPEMLAVLASLTSIFGHFGSQNGSPESPPEVFFRLCFPDAVLHRFFVVFSVKSIEIQKMKKCVSIYKLHTILEVAPSKKNRCLREKALSIQARISVKNRVKIGPDSDSERQRHQKPTKIASDAVSERTLSAPGAILLDLGVPARA